MKIFLDDIRNTPDGWVRCYWPDEVLSLIDTYLVEEISLDHDLGDDHHGTGYDVLLRMEEMSRLGQLKYLPKITIHSANPVGKQKMLIAIGKIKDFYEQNRN